MDEMNKIRFFFENFEYLYIKFFMLSTHPTLVEAET